MCKTALYVLWFCNVSKLINFYFTDINQLCSVQLNIQYPSLELGLWSWCGLWSRGLTFSFVKIGICRQGFEKYVVGFFKCIIKSMIFIQYFCMKYLVTLIFFFLQVISDVFNLGPERYSTYSSSRARVQLPAPTSDGSHLPAASASVYPTLPPNTDADTHAYI